MLLIDCAIFKVEVRKWEYLNGFKNYEKMPAFLKNK